MTASSSVTTTFGFGIANAADLRTMTRPGVYTLSKLYSGNTPLQRRCEPKRRNPMPDASIEAAQLLTVVVCSSPVPSNPQTDTLRATFRSLHRVTGLSSCPKVIHLDGPQASLPAARVAAYAEFTHRVRALSSADADFTHAQVYASPVFLFAAHNLAAAIGHVNTSFLLSLQHDYEIARPFDLHGLLRTMVAVPVVRHVRLNMRANAPAKGFDGVVANATELLPAGATYVPLTRTCGWSDAPHIASTSYYRDFAIPKNLGDHRGGRRKFMEESLHYPMQRNGMPGGCWEAKQRVKAAALAAGGGSSAGRVIWWPKDFDDFGTYLYGMCLPTDGFYSKHNSLRGGGGQWGLDHHPLGHHPKLDGAMPRGRRMLSHGHRDKAFGGSMAMAMAVGRGRGRGRGRGSERRRR